MSRRNDSLLDAIVEIPWPWGVGIGVFFFLLIRYGIGWYFVAYGGPIGQNVGEQLLRGSITPIAVIVMLMCWTAAAFSYQNTRQRQRLLDTQTGLASLTAIHWRDFERLVGEAFRRQGHAVEETGLGGADGGVDLILRKNGRRELVQCKQWRSRQVKASVVREMWGLVAHHKVDGVKIVCVGDFTRDAKQFAEDKAIELVHGQRLLEMIRDVQATPAPTQTRAASPTTARAAPLPAPACPKCGGTMARRVNKTTKQEFWGCMTFPKCRGTLQAAPSTD